MITKYFNLLPIFIIKLTSNEEKKFLKYINKNISLKIHNRVSFNLNLWRIKVSNFLLVIEKFMTYQIWAKSWSINKFFCRISHNKLKLKAHSLVKCLSVCLSVCLSFQILFIFKTIMKNKIQQFVCCDSRKLAELKKKSWKKNFKKFFYIDLKN